MTLDYTAHAANAVGAALLSSYRVARASHKADATSSPMGLVCAVCGRPVTQVHHRDGTIGFRHRSVRP